MDSWENVARQPKQQQQLLVSVGMPPSAPVHSRRCALRGTPRETAPVVSKRERSFNVSPLKLDEGEPTTLARADFQRKNQAWFAATELQSDLVVEVGKLKCHLHKFPLLSRSGRLNRLVFESRDTETDRIKLESMPGGPEAFELAAKFCYGIPIDLNASNVAAVRCVAEYLEMVEELEEGNLIAKTEAFLNLVVLPSWKDSLTVLLSCDESLYPWADKLQLVSRCSESIAWKACTEPKGPVTTTAKPAWYLGFKDVEQVQVPRDWWYEDLCLLCFDHFSRVIAGIKAKGMKSELLGGAIMLYAYKWIPGLSDESKTVKEDSSSRAQSKNSRVLIESIVSLLPAQKGAVSCKFLLQMLRVAKHHGTSLACKTELEKRAGMQLEQATLTDLLNLSTTDMHRIVEYYLCEAESPDKSPGTQGTKSVASSCLEDDNKSCLMGIVLPSHDKCYGKVRVAKLLDGYLAEVAHDPGLSLAEFQALAQALPAYSRACHDGLYRAIDMYLKAHPNASQQDRKRLCRIMDCNRLSTDARLHASQNDRLPLRTVVQVLFSEHIKMKTVYGYGTGYGADVTGSQEIRALKKDVEKIKEQFVELRTGYNHMKHDLEKLVSNSSTGSRGSSSSSTWGCGWKRISSTLASPRFFHNSWSEDVRLTPDIFKSRRWR